ncbi:MAG TPA: glycoside hydrolase family 3 N-terminal domain-containing protein [Terrimicrobiaceae bacterium]
MTNLLRSCFQKAPWLALIFSATVGNLISEDFPIYKDASKTIEVRIADLLQRMTPAEKAGQLTQGVVRPGAADPDAYAEPIRLGAIGSYILSLGSDDPAARNLLQEIAVKESRLGIPLIFGFDTIHGLRTVFPIPLAVSCAWDPELFEKLESVAARESRAAGIDWVFGPMCDLARDPRWGRGAETFGEDPYLASLYAAAAVRGLQGRDPSATDRVAACLKHFAGYSAAVGGRDYNHTEIPIFAMRNLFLPAFHAGVDAGVLTLMSAFNANDGIPSTASKFLLTQVLREEWGFSGFVVSDWEGVHETILWGLAADEEEAARMALEAGTDMEMVSNTYRDTLPAQIANGSLSGATLDTAVSRVLGVKFRLGLFENPFTDGELFRTTMLQPDALALAREAAIQSCVLLKNQQLLPLKKSLERIALIGPFADDRDEMLGTWAGHGRAADVITLAEGIRRKLPNAHIDLLQGCPILETQRTRTLTDGKVVIDTSASDSHTATIEDAVQAASSADVCVLALGEPRGWTGENASRARLTLTGRQQELLDRVAATGKPVVVVLFCGRPLQLAPILEKAQALVVAWQPGIQGGNALADLLFDDAAPSGRLTMSFPIEVGQVPLYYNRYNTGRPATEMVNYRELTREPLFPFGFGLTYTSFAYDPVQIHAGEPAVASARITNTGTRAGDEVVQLYVRDMACQEGARPQQELRGFEKLSLQPGESREVRFKLTDEVLGFVGRNGGWHVEPGSFQIWIAPHAQTGTPATYQHWQR